MNDRPLLGTYHLNDSAVNNLSPAIKMAAIADIAKLISPLFNLYSDAATYPGKAYDSVREAYHCFVDLQDKLTSENSPDTIEGRISFLVNVMFILEALYQFNKNHLQDSTFENILKNVCELSPDSFEWAHLSNEKRIQKVMPNKIKIKNKFSPSEIKEQDVHLDNQETVTKTTYPYLHSSIPISNLDFDEKNQDGNITKMKTSADISESKIFDDSLQTGSKNEYLVASAANPDKKQFVLGAGSFGEVCIAQNKENNNWAAIKIPHKPLDYTDMDSIRTFISEVNNLNQSGMLLFADLKNGVIGMKLCEGFTLYDLVRDPLIKANFSMLQLLTLMKNFAKQIHHQHTDVSYFRKKFDEKEKKERNVSEDVSKKNTRLHEDVKLLNAIGSGSTLEVNIVDFGATENVELELKSVNQNEDKKEKQQKKLFGGIKKNVGVITHVYAAPEVLLHGYHTPASDTYSFGMNLAEVLNATNTISSTELEIKKNTDLPSGLNELISLLTSKEPSERPEGSEIGRLFNNIIKELKEKEEQRIVVVSITDFLKLNEASKDVFSDFYFSHKINAVVLQKTPRNTIEEYYRACNELKKLKIVSVCPEVLEGKNPASIYCVAKNYYHEKLNADRVRVYSYNDFDPIPMNDQTDLATSVHVQTPSSAKTHEYTASSSSSTSTTISTSTSYSPGLFTSKESSPKDDSADNIKKYVELITNCCLNLDWTEQSKTLGRKMVPDLIVAKSIIPLHKDDSLTSIVQNANTPTEVKFNKIISLIKNKEANPKHHGKMYSDFLKAAKQGIEGINELGILYKEYSTKQLEKEKEISNKSKQ
jgi:serine/threonine protein kinase